MSREAVALSRQLCRASGRTDSPLLFLYQTRTLLSPAWQNTPTHSFSTSSARPALEDAPFQDSTSKNAASYNGLEIPESTITAPERAIFDRIFKNIVSNKPANSSTTENEDPFDAISSEDVTLESIFENAIKEAKKGPRKRLKRPGGPEIQELTLQQALSNVVRPVIYTRVAQRNRFPAELQRSLDAARAAAMANQPTTLQPGGEAIYRWRMTDIAEAEEMGRKVGEPLDEYERLVERARKKDKERVKSLLDAAGSDMAIWRVLEKEVFARMRELTALLKREEKAKQAAAGKTSRRPSSKIPLLNVVEGLDLKKPRGRSRKTTSAEATEATAPTDSEVSPTPSSELLSALSPPPQPPPQPQPHPLSILQTNYAPHLLHALRLLRRKFPTSPYALSLLATFKRLGPISYVLGASIPLYNELLYLRWAHYRDLHGCADLVAEMLEKGVGTDGLTHAVFRDAEKEKRRVGRARKKGVEGVGSAWWGLQGVVSGWGRWKAEAKRAEQVWWEESERLRRERDEMSVVGQEGEEEWEDAMEGEEDVDVVLAEDGAWDEGSSTVPSPAERKPLDVDGIFGVRPQ
ncbi:hypothetical protein MMC30_003765 [Trapelia coarctata]|nr:hypothetical protein [Trapelia coarctata]